MEIHDLVWIITCCLILVNIVYLIVGTVKKQLRWYEVLIILAISITIPYLVAFITAQFYSGWEGLEKTIIAFIYAIFAEMVLLTVYLFRKLKLQNKV